MSLPEFSKQSRLSRLSSGNGGKTAVRTHPTSRAGGQDYGSFNKLPQISLHALATPPWPECQFSLNMQFPHGGTIILGTGWHIRAMQPTLKQY